MDKAEEKMRIRRLVAVRRRGMSEDERAATSLRAQERLMSLPEFSFARRIGVYLAVGSEVSTHRIIEECMKRGIGVCVPAYRGDAEGYAMAWLSPSLKVKAGWKGVPEPSPRRWVSCETLDIVIVPGVAFDACGGRLGHGGGHYDRLLRRRPFPLFTIGLAFEKQIVPRVPMDAHDVRMDAVVTEKRVFRVQTSRRNARRKWRQVR